MEKVRATLYFPNVNRKETLTHIVGTQIVAFVQIVLRIVVEKNLHPVPLL